MVLQTKYFFVDTSRSSIPYGTKFLRILIFAIFSSDRQKLVPANRDYRKHFFPQKCTPE